MPNTRGEPLPSEILAAMKDPSIVSWLRSQALATASAESTGRYPGLGAAQNDNFPYNDNVDNNSPAYIDYVLPLNFQRIVSARLSIKNRAYRTYNSFSATNTGAGTAHNHGNHAHTHPTTHFHGLNIAGGVAGNPLTTFVGGPLVDNVGGGGVDNISVLAVAPGSTANSTVPNENAHTHPLSLAGTLGVTEAAAPVNPATTIAFDGVDHTAALGGPFNSDVVELDITKFISTAVSIWHTVSLQPNQLVRMVALLRISYYVDSRLAQ